MRKILVSVLLMLVLAVMAATAAAAPLADVITPSDKNWAAYLDAHPEAFATAPARSAVTPRTVMYPVTITKKLVGIAPEDLPDGTVFTYVLQDSNAVDQGLPFPQITKQNLIDGNGEYSVTAYSLMDDIFVKEQYAGAEIAGHYLEISATVHEQYRPDWSAGFVYRDNGYVAPPMTLVYSNGAFNNGEVVFTNTYVKDPGIAPLPEVPGKYPITIMKRLEGIEPRHLPDGAAFIFQLYDSNGVSTGEFAEITKEDLIAGGGTAYKTLYTEFSGIFVGEQVNSKRFPMYGAGKTTTFVPNKFWTQWYSEPYGDSYVYTRPIDLVDKHNQINNAFVGFINTYGDALLWVDGIAMNDGDYLPSGASMVTDTKPASGGYAHLELVDYELHLTLHDFELGAGRPFDIHSYVSLYDPNPESMLHIHLEGENSITTPRSEELYYAGIIGDLIFIEAEDPEASLTIDADDVGVFAARQLRMIGGTVDISAQKTGVELTQYDGSNIVVTGEKNLGSLTIRSLGKTEGEAESAVYPRKVEESLALWGNCAMTVSYNASGYPTTKYSPEAIKDYDYIRIAKVPTMPVSVTLQVQGVKPGDIPDGTEFILPIFNVKDDTWMTNVVFSSDEIAACNGSVTKVVEVPKQFEVAEVRPQAMGAYELFVSADADAGIDTAITGPEKVDETYFSVAQFSIRNFEAVQSNPNDPYAPMPISEDGLPEIVITNEFVKIPDMPQTGDESDILLWLSLALSSMTALMLVSRKKREA